MKEPFRIRAKRAIIQATRQRLFLIRNNKSKNWVTFDQCTSINEQLNNLYSNKQLAELITQKSDLLLNVVPGNNHKLLATFHTLMAEAESIISIHKSKT